MACDTTFGVTKEQRNLFLFAGIDSNNKVFIVFRCSIPSKEARAYNWAQRIAIRHLVGGKYCHSISVFPESQSIYQQGFLTVSDLGLYDKYKS